MNAIPLTSSRRGYQPLGTGSSTSQSYSLGYSLFAWAARKRVLVVIFMVGIIIGGQIFLLGPSIVGEDKLNEWGLEEWHRPLPWQKPPHEHQDYDSKRPPPPPHQQPPHQQPSDPLVPPTLQSESPYPFPEDIPNSGDSSLHITSYSFPAPVDAADRSASYSNFSHIYPREDPHRGEIAETFLRVLQSEVKPILPPRPPVAPTITSEMWNRPSWNPIDNGSRTNHLDAINAAHQPIESDWRSGIYNFWKPPLDSLANTKPISALPKVQFDFQNSSKFSGKNSDPKREELIIERRRLVKNAFLHSFSSYKKLAWGHDELKPVSEVPQDNFNGWGATIVDALDTLLVMDLPDEYDLARQHVRDINFQMVGGERSAYGSADGQIPVFETAIRYLGGFLSAYDLSGDVMMRDRAEELAQLIMPSFDTLTGVPVGRIRLGLKPGKPLLSGAVILAEAGSMLLEFTRLWQVTGNRTYFDRVQRTTDWLDRNMTSSNGRLGSLFPTMINPERGNMYGWYTFGGMADSYYEYLIKEHQLLGGRIAQYGRMYSSAIDSAINWLFRNVRTIPGVDSLLVIGQANGKSHTPKLEHLSCFSGGMLALGSKILPERKDDIHHARRFTETCWWAYNSSATGIGPEDLVFYKPTDTDRYKITTLEDGTERRGSPRGHPIQGVKSVNGDYRNRPETIESVLYMYRITGDPVWQERGWQMFASWVTHCMTNVGFSSIRDVTQVPTHRTDSMESFTFAETFKYYYLLFSPPDLISLDDYVFTTEAHPLLLPKKGRWPTPGKGPRSFWNIGNGSGVDVHVAPAASGFYIGGEGGAPGEGTNAQKHALFRAWTKKHQKGTGTDLIAREIAGLGSAGKEAFKSALSRLLGVNLEVREGVEGEHVEEGGEREGQDESQEQESGSFFALGNSGKELRSFQDEEEANSNLETFQSQDLNNSDGESVAGAAAALRVADQINLATDDDSALKIAAAVYAELTGQDAEELEVEFKEQHRKKTELAQKALEEFEIKLKNQGIQGDLKLELSDEAKMELKRFNIDFQNQNEAEGLEGLEEDQGQIQGQGQEQEQEQDRDQEQEQVEIRSFGGSGFGMAGRS